MTQRGFTLGVGAAVLFLVLATYLAWRFILNPKVNLPSATNSIGMEFVQIPAGKFLMGSPESEDGRGDDEDEHEVEITQPYYLATHEVTQEQFRKVMGENPLVFTSSKSKPDFPVTDVSYDDAVEFCKKLSDMPAEKAAKRSYRLPTEAEWERACRAGGKNKPYSTGSTLAVDQANSGETYAYREKARQDAINKRRKRTDPFENLPPIPPSISTEAVGSYPANHWGLFDMHGNVWEWCSDWYEADYYHHSPARDPKGPENGMQRVARGGSWVSEADDCRSARRFAFSPSIRLGMGFRVVMVQENP
jgi:formylglycine-generating enzyme required for sulfatase activity